MAKKIRDYVRFTQRLEALARPHLQVETIGVVNDYPVHRVLLGENRGKRKNVLVTSGTHGDEPAGPKAVLHFLRRDLTDLLQHFNFLILPCINPYGYVHSQRENREGEDINRAFEKENVAEANIVKEALRKQRFSLFIEFHEDWEATGFYLYEGRHETCGIGPEIIRRVEKIGPIDTETSENDILVSKGVYGVDPAWGTQGMASYIHHFHSDHVITCETPTGWDLERRADAHQIALDTVLEHHRRTGRF